MARVGLRETTRPRLAGRAWAFLLRSAGAVLVFCAGAALLLGALGPVSYTLDALAHLRLQFALAALGGALLIAWGGALRGALASSVVGLAGLIGLGPAWTPPAAAPEACVADRLVVATANVHNVNPDFDRLVDALLEADADLLATQESVPGFWAATRRLQAAYPYRLTDFPGGTRSEAVMLWSKRPLRVLEINEGRPDAPALALAEIDLGGRAVAVGGIHASRPVIGPQRRQFEGAARIFRAAPAARIVMGDFNATPWSHGMRIAQRSLGAALIPGFRITWRGRYPNPLDRRRGWKPPAILGNQIDHVLVSEHFAVERIETFALPGSVHFGVKAALQLKRDRCS